MDSTSKQITEDILSRYYPVVRNLYTYIKSVTGLHDETRRDTLTHETDTLRYRKFLEETVVASHNSDFESKKLQIAAPVGHLREVIERGQITLIRAKSSTKNILTTGYRLGDASKGNDRKSLITYFVNTTITAFYSPEWNTLYERVGVDIMLHLLTETSLFLRLPNECLCQIAGEPLTNLPVPTEALLPAPLDIERDNHCGYGNALKRKGIGAHPDEPVPKRSRSIQTSTMTVHVRPTISSERSPVRISIARLRLFYRRPDRMSRTHKISFGFPLKYVLNELAPAQLSTLIQQRPDLRRQAAAARHLSKYIFPRQYGLPNAFNEADNGPYNFEDHDREAQIKARGKCKTPKRLKSTLDLLDKLLWRHSKCAYKPLLQRLCPSKIGTDVKDSLDETVILEMMAENSTQLFSQSRLRHNVSVDSQDRKVTAKGLTQAATHVKHKPRFAEFMCPYAEVFRFAVVVTKSVIPSGFWGSKHNFKLVTNRIRALISMRRYETFTLHTILQGFRTSDCEWLMPNSPAALKQSRVSASDSRKRVELLQEFLFWYFEYFLIPLLRTNFYITESGAFRNKVLYFRQDDWDTLCKPLVERLCATTFQRLTRNDAQEILRQRKLGFSFVRLLPKETGVRPIVNLRRKRLPGNSEHGFYTQSINQIMSAAFHILTYEKEAKQHLLGASVFGQNEIYTKLKGFKKKLLGQSQAAKLPKLYFVKVDVQTCFDTIEQTKLLEILRDIISEEEYSIQRHGQVCSVTGKVRRSFVKTGIPADDQPHFLRTACQLAETLRNTIFVDQVLYPSAQRNEILELLEQHITDNIVKIGNNYYRQAVGIPQGSILSSLLCSFFYGDLERTELRFTDDAQSVLLRLIDDYLFVTTDLKQARKFLRVMHRGHPEYGCFISQDKTLTNFEDETMPNVVDLSQKGFPWCGFQIDMTDLSVSFEYSRFHETYLEDSLTVDFGRKPGASFVQKMLQLAKSKSHVIFTDPELNAPHTIHRNIYENFLVTAMKMHYYLRSWRFDSRKGSAFLINTIRQMIRYAHSTMKNKAKTAKASEGKYQTQKATVLWLGVHAFHTALSCKSQAYQAVLRALEFDLSLPQYRLVRKRMKKVVREGREVISVLSF